MVTLPAMSTHLEAIASLLRGAGWSVHMGSVIEPLPTLPYALIQARPGTPRADSLCDTQDTISETVRVTIVSDSGSNCLRDVEDARQVLHGATPTVPGRRVYPLRLVDSQPVTADREVTRTDTRTHPHYGTDAWRLVSVPDD